MSFFLNEWRDVAERTSLGKSFQIFGASEAKKTYILKWQSVGPQGTHHQPGCCIL